jgi:hypothetical protein
MNKIYIVYNDVGEIIKYGSCGEEVVEFQKNINEQILILSEPVEISQYYVSNNTLIKYTETELKDKANKPAYFAFWNNISMSWDDPRPPQQKLDQQWINIKIQRDQLLQQSDWRVVKAADTGVPLSQEWKDYRQALRDITLQSDPFNITWPIAPT